MDDTIKILCDFMARYVFPKVHLYVASHVTEVKTFYFKFYKHVRIHEEGV